MTGDLCICRSALAGFRAARGRISALAACASLGTAFLVSALAVAIPASAVADSARRVVKVAVCGGKGYYERGPAGEPVGAGYVLMEKLRPNLPFDIQYAAEAKDIDQCMEMLERGEVDMVDMMFYKVSLRSKFVYATYPSCFSSSVVSVPAKSSARFRTGDYNAWNGMRAAIVGGVSMVKDFEEFARSRGFSAETVECASVEDFAQLCREGRADVLVHDSTLSADGCEDVTHFGLKPRFYAVRVGDAWLASCIDAAFDKLNAAEPGWRAEVVKANCPRQKVSVAVAHAQGEVGKSDAGLAMYSRALTEHLAAILAWDVEFVESDAVPIHDGTANADVVCGVTRESASREVRARLTKCPAGRSTVAVLSRSNDKRFLGVKPSDWPFVNIGYFGLEEGRPRVFERFAAQERVKYHLEGRAVVGEPRNGLRKGDFDLGISYSRLTNEEFSVAACVGNLEFYYGVRPNLLELRNLLDSAIEYARVYDSARYLSMMENFLGYVSPPKSKTLRVGAFLKSGTCEFDDNGELDGYVIRYLRKLAETAGWYLDEIPVPIVRAMGYLESGRVDVVAGINRAQALTKLFDFTKDDLGSACQSLMVMAGGRLLLNRPDTWQGMRVGILRGTLAPKQLEQFLESRGVRWSVLHYTSLRDAERDVRMGRIEAVYTAPDRNVRDLLPLVTQTSSAGHIVLSRHNQGLKARFDSAMQRLDREHPEFRQSLFETFFPDGTGGEMLTPAEIDYVQSRANRPVKIDISPLTPLLAEYDESSGSAVGFARHILDEMSAFSGLKFELAWPVDDNAARARLDTGRTEVRIGFAGTVLKTDNAIPLYETINLPMARVRRANSGSSVGGTVALFKGAEVLRSVVVRHGFEPRMYPGRTACYSAVMDGSADYTVDSYHLAKYFIQERGLYPGLAIEPIDQRRGSLPVTVAVGARTDSLLRTTVEKAVAHISAYDVDDVLTTALRNVQRPVLTGGQLALLLGSILLAVAIAFAFMRLKYEAHMRSQRQRLLFLEKIEQQQSELSKALDAANAANRAKTVFLSSMSHDIRTPMNAILGYTSMVKDSPDDVSKVKQFVSKIDMAGQHLLALINEVLEMSRIESGKVQLSEQPVNLLERAHAMMSIIESSASQKGLTVELKEGPVANWNVVVDANRLDQVVQNILGNAIKYTPAGGTVKMTIADEPCDRQGFSLFVLTVEDNGIGMSKEFLEHVFDEFSREQTSTVSGIQGTGLGLSIVKRLVEIMGGTVEIFSEQGKGTKVVSKIPMRLQERKEEPKPEQKADVAPASLNGLNFLLVEDNEMNREVATWMLTGQGAKVTDAVNGKDAVEKFEKSVAEDGERFDVILMDVQMPVMDGYGATRAIRELETRLASGTGRSPHRIPIIALSANAFEEDRKRSFEAGMDDHVAKPIKLSSLLEAVTKVLASKREA